MIFAAFRRIARARLTLVVALVAYVGLSIARWLVAPAIVQSIMAIPVWAALLRPTGETLLFLASQDASPAHLAVVATTSFLSRVVLDVSLFILVRYHALNFVDGRSPAVSRRLAWVRSSLPTGVLLGITSLLSSPITVTATAMTTLRTRLAVLPILFNAMVITLLYLWIGMAASPIVSSVRTWIDENSTAVVVVVAVLVITAIGLFVVNLARLRRAYRFGARREQSIDPHAEGPS